MKLEENLRKQLGAELYQAWQTRSGGELFSVRYPEITLVDAYNIQLYTLEHYIANGSRVTGKKIGLTSKMQELFGVYEPDFGNLLDNLAFNSGAEIPADLLIQPKVEGEIAFVLNSDLTGKLITARDVLDATAYVTAAIEVVDSRYGSWRNLKLNDSVSDNASFVVPMSLAGQLVPYKTLICGLWAWCLNATARLSIQAREPLLWGTRRTALPGW